MSVIIGEPPKFNVYDIRKLIQILNIFLIFIIYYTKFAGLVIILHFVMLFYNLFFFFFINFKFILYK